MQILIKEFTLSLSTEQSSPVVSPYLRKGTINSKGAKYVYSYTTDYVCNGGDKTEEGLDLEHG